MGRRTRTCLAGGLALALLASGAAAGGAGALGVRVGVPGVGVGDVAVPDPTVPTVTVPSVPVPSVPAPPVGLPPSPLPSPLPAPAPAPLPLPLPPTPAPPAVSAPPTPGVADPHAPPAAGAGDAEPAAGGSSSGAPAAHAPDTGAPTRGAGSRPKRAGGGQELSAGPHAQRRLERAVARLQRCLDRLSPRAREVLLLRAGLGPRDSLSRERVARRLDLGFTQTGRIERRGLRRLGTLGDAGTCGGATRAPGVALGGARPGPTGAGGASHGMRPRFGVAGTTAHGGGQEDSRSPFDALPPPLGHGGEATLLIALALAVALTLLVRRELSRR